jgi:hypothetical protein
MGGGLGSRGGRSSAGGQGLPWYAGPGGAFNIPR